jgi:asparagine synthase (glutamine-hydrolysing)
MCGVIGVVGKGAHGLCRVGLDALAHRGLPGRSRVLDGRVGRTSDEWAVGHVRLPIVGVGEENDQPLERWRGTSASAFAWVGELLERADGTPIKNLAACDTLVARQLFYDEGPGGFTDLDGFWSIVSYDGARLRALTDYLAQKPLYFRAGASFAAVASEPAALARLAGVTLDEVYLAACQKWGYCPDGARTPFNEIKKLGPGCYVELEPGSAPKITKVDALLPAFCRTTDSLTYLIERAVKVRVQHSDVPVALLASGGLDSSIVLELARRYGDVNVYHARNEGDAPPADVSREIDPDEVPLATALEWMQEPIDLGSLQPQAALSAAVKAAGGERVCLTGDGADELFGGYARASVYDSQASDVWHELLCWHLPRLDRIMMRNQIEVRSPFLSRWVASAALGLPWEERRDKAILRRAFRDVLPAGVADRPKVPLKHDAVRVDRQARSIRLVNLFREAWTGDRA